MAHFAKLDKNNNVLEVNVVNNSDINDLPFPESEPVGIEFLTKWSEGYTNWKQTSFNGNFRANYAAIGGKYDPVNDVFIHPKPCNSWVLNSQYQWEPPVPMPTDGKFYVWNEELINWVEITE